MIARVIETNVGIQGAMTVAMFDEFARTMRDKGWNNVDAFLRAGINRGNVLEVGPGPDYVGLEWLKKAEGATLTALEISAEMMLVAKKNAKEYGMTDRVRYVQGNAMTMPFEKDTFDGVFSNGSLHEWEKPLAVLNEIHRVLKPGGVVCIADLRRDANPILKQMIYHTTKPAAIRPGFLSSIHAAYTEGEMTELMRNSDFHDFSVHCSPLSLCLCGRKEPAAPNV